MSSFFSMFKEFKSIFIVFTLIISIFFIFLVHNKNQQIAENLKILQSNYDTQFKITYDNLKKISQNTFYGIVNKPEIYNNLKNNTNKGRKELYKNFISDYNRLLGYGFNQIHFHTKDNKSFLRMHKPNKFGDDLTNIRESVVKANKELRPVEGFEMGRYIHGFRFIYPIFDKNLFHLGSVEVSISSETFERNYEKDYQADLHFLLRKDIAKNKMFDIPYKRLITSFENSDYLFNKNGKNELYHFSYKDFYTDAERKIIKDKMSKGENFILDKNTSKQHLTVYFKSISNTQHINNTSYIVIYTNSEYLKLLDKNYKIINMVLLLIIVVFIFFMRNKYEQNNKIRQQKDIFNQQSKLASIGELINNIAHQWRQPLSVISTSASGVKIQHEFGILDDDSLEKAMDTIVDQTQSLSKTIEDFRNLNTKDKKKEPFDLKNIINHSIHIFDEEINRKSIKILSNTQSCELISYPEEIKQVLIILIKNAIEAIKDNGIILINTTIKNKLIIINIQDSGGGIPKNKIAKIFDPYFTTKHKSQGTGIALYTAYELINNSFDGSLEAKNREFTYKFESYKGAMFSIKLYKERL